MCGIAGLALRTQNEGLRERFAALAFAHLARRGPDARNRERIDAGDGISLDLIHTRLSIIDIDGGRQPMADDDGTLVYNGEIYNFNDLRFADATYATRSDTEVLLKGLARQKLEFLNRAEGMYAFAWHDRRHRRLIVARDEFGIKPAYLVKTDSAFAFASSLPPLMALSRKEINERALQEYYMSRGMRGAHTIFTDIVEVEPGQAYVLDLDTWRLEAIVWARPRTVAPRRGSDAGLLAELEDILDRSVKRHLISDVPVAALLSGGIDSSLMTAFAARHTDHLAAFTIGFRDEAYDESQHAAAVARRYGLKHHVYFCEDEDFIGLIADWPLVLDDAVANPSTVLLYAVSQFARDTGHKVLLAGEGADEFFGGYHQQWRYAMARRINPLTRPFGFAAGMLQRAAPQKTRLVHAAHLATDDCSFHGTSTIVEPWLAREMFAAEPQPLPRATTLADALLLDQTRRLPDDMLTAADRATMHASVEARVPFITREVADFARSLDDSQLISGLTQKVILRKLARRHVPASCIDRRKVGFDLPLSRWFRTSLRERLTDALASTWQRDYFRPGALERIVGWHLEGKADLPDKLWAFWMLENNVRALRAL